ncbi:MAG: methylmalonyl-CoA mutase family protein [Pseudomonadota bacterium]
MAESVEPADPIIDAWRSLAERALKGAALESLDFAMDDGVRADAISLPPLAAPATPVYTGRATAGPWAIVQRVDTDGTSAKQATDDLQNGATALSLVFAGAPAAFGAGLTAATVSDLDAALDGVYLNLVPIHLQAGALGLEALVLMAGLAKARGTPLHTLHAGIDPLGALAATGEGFGADGIQGRLQRAVAAHVALGVKGTALVADGSVYAEAGATPVQELALALWTLRDYAAALDAEGVPPSQSLPQIAMHLCASQEQFVTMAKMRAARRLHALFCEACGVSAPLTLHATTARRMLAVSDPHTNLLRLTIAAFGAGVGGADAVTVLPFDQASSAFARRMGRNIQTLLLEESHLGALMDPAAGSGTIETLTDEMARAAWALFQAEAGGGASLADALIDGRIARLCGAIAQEPVIIGVTKHPPPEPYAATRTEAIGAPQTRALNVTATDVDGMIEAALKGATLADLAAWQPPQSLGSHPLRPLRDSAHFEA